MNDVPFDSVEFGPTFHIWQQPDGGWIAVKDDPDPDARGASRVLKGWDDIERLRGEWNRTDCWPEGSLEQFAVDFGPRPNL